jgi:hypothetical protein
MSELSPTDLDALLNTEDSQARATLRAAFRRSLYITTKVGVCFLERPNLMSAKVFKPRSDWLQWIVTDHKRGLLEDPRSFIKSTASSRALPVWLAIQRPHDEYDHPQEVERALNFLAQHPHLRGPDTRIIIGSDSKDRAGMFVDSSRTEWMTNPILRWLFPELLWPNYNRRSYGPWSQLEYSLPGRLNPAMPDPYCRAVGIDSKEQGGRAEILIIDDLVGETSYKSSTELDRRKRWVRTVTNLLENSNYRDPNGGVVLVVENRWSLDDVNSMIHDELRDWSIWRRGAYPCIVHNYDSCGRWGSDETKECGPQSISLWTDRYPDVEALEAVRRDKGDEVFAAQWLNDPTIASALDEAKFNTFVLEPATVRDPLSGTIVRDLCAITQNRDGQTGDTIPISSLTDHLISIDPATSTDHTAARTAISWMATDKPTLRRYWLDCRAGRWDADEAVLQAVQLIEHVSRLIGRTPRILCEKVAAQSYMGTAIKILANQRRLRVHEVEMIAPKRGPGKVDRITQRVGNVLGQGLYYLRAGLALPRAEVRHFPTGTLDTLDTAAQAEEVFLRTYSAADSNALLAARKRARRLRLARSTTTGAPLL